MRPIPKKLRERINKDPFYNSCIHSSREKSSPCSGRITLEHAILYTGKQVNELWAIVPCCEHHNIGVSGEEKNWNRYIALLRASEADLKKYPKRNWTQELHHFVDLFDEPVLCLK